MKIRFKQTTSKFRFFWWWIDLRIFVSWLNLGFLAITVLSTNTNGESAKSSNNNNDFDRCSEIEIRRWATIPSSSSSSSLTPDENDDGLEFNEDDRNKRTENGIDPGLQYTSIPNEADFFKQAVPKSLDEKKIVDQKRLQLTINKVLGKIDNLSRGIGAELCTTPSKNNTMFPTIPIGTHVFHVPKEKADLIAYFISSNGNTIIHSAAQQQQSHQTPSRGSSNNIHKPIVLKLPESQKIETIFEALYRESEVSNVRFVEYSTNSKTSTHFIYEREFHHTSSSSTSIKKTPVQTTATLNAFPWFFDPSVAIQQQQHSSSSSRNIEKGFLHGRFIRENETLLSQLGIEGNILIREDTSPSHLNVSGFWSWPYFKCSSNNNGEIVSDTDNEASSSDKIRGKWLISYSVAFILPSAEKKNQPITSSYGLLSFDVNLTNYSINQCGFTSQEERLLDLKSNALFAFRETHKCNTDSTKCHFRRMSPRNGWRKGNYDCICKANHYAYYPTWNNVINGFKAESVWCKKITNVTFTNEESSSSSKNETDLSSKLRLLLPTGFEELVSCSLCPDECPNCTDGKSCMADMNVIFRLVLLCVSIICSIATFGLIIVVYKFRKLPILKNSSPIFLCLTLVGCIIMYSEMVALFPKLKTRTCIAVKWTRHLGFCVTYTSLYMKLCRVYLTYRVKSAHKIKLTEKHLLHWMSPIMVIMLLYLFAWTISDPPAIDILMTWDEKKFTQCKYNWWDHSLAIGEFIFLIYGVWICWRIRENPDAQFISYSIYNIAVVNTVMVSVHLLIAPDAGPDLKYLFAFLRTQLSTTVTIALVLGSRLYHIARGDAASKKEIASSLNGFGHETLDLAEENQQLKEELQKMAMQMERLKSYAMCKNNPHLKSSGHVTIDKDFGRLDSFTAI